MEPRWRIYMLGGLTAQGEDRRVTRFHRHGDRLLAYLAYHRRQSHPRDVLVERLWPEADPDVSRRWLDNAVWSLKQDLEPDVLTSDPASVAVNDELVTTDVAEFEEILKR